MNRWLLVAVVLVVLYLLWHANQGKQVFGFEFPPTPWSKYVNRAQGYPGA